MAAARGSTTEGHFDPLLISSLISLKLPQFSYLCLRDTYRGIHEECFGGNAFVLFQSSTKL